MGQLGFAVDRCKRAVHGVRTVGNLYAANAWDIIPRVKGEPLLPQVHFTVGMKVHWRARINVTDFRQMAGHVPGGQIESPAQRYGSMGKVAADTAALSRAEMSVAA